MCTGAVGDVSQCCNLEIESAALGSAKSCRSSRWECSERFHNELVMFSLYQEPRFVLAMNSKSISIVEFPKVQCPALVDVWLHAGAIPAKDVP
jgi:hypothetical protein